MKLIHRVNTYLCLTALILIAVGVVCVLYPTGAFEAIAWIIGLLILCSGFITLIFGLRAQSLLPNAGSTTLMAIVQILIGLLFLGSPILAEGVLVAIFAFWVMVEGASLMLLSFDYKKSEYRNWWIMLVLGICSIVLGLIALCNSKGTGNVLTVFIGLGIIANGVERLIAIGGIRKIEHRVQDVKDSINSIDLDKLTDR